MPAFLFWPLYPSAGSITGTEGRCGTPGCHCHGPDDPGHDPHPRLTRKANGKTVTESFPTPVAQRKAERKIETLRGYRQWERSFVEIQETNLPSTPGGGYLQPAKRRLKPSAGKSRAK